MSGPSSSQVLSKKQRRIICAVLALVAGAWLTVMNMPGYVPAEMIPEQRTPADLPSQFMTEYSGVDQIDGLRAAIAQAPAGQLAVVMFHATWCPYCKRLTQYLQESATRTDQPFTVIKVDVERFQRVAAALKREDGIPETFVYRDGQMIYTFGGSPKLPGEVVSLLNSLQSRPPLP